MSPTEAQAPGRRQMAVSDLGQVLQRRDAPLGQPIPPRLDTLEPAIDVAEHDPPGVGRHRRQFARRQRPGPQGHRAGEGLLAGQVSSSRVTRSANTFTSQSSTRLSARRLG